MVMEWDPGPVAAIKTILEQAPISEYESVPTRFRLEWGPMFYRGRTDGSAKLLIIGQDPAADENIARRVMVGTAGQRLQGYLAKLGITRSYVIVNSVLYSIFGQFDAGMQAFIDRPAVAAWRNQLLSALLTSNTQAILAFGNAAKHVVSTWSGASALNSQGRVFNLLHPTARPESTVRSNWSSKLAAISAKVTQDPDGSRDLSAYTGSNFKNSDLARVPLRDFGFGAPRWMGTGNAAQRVKKGGQLPAAAKKVATILVIPGDTLG